MIRIAALAGAVGLFGISAVGALAAPPVDTPIKAFEGPTLGDACGMTSGNTVGQLRIVARGKSGKGLELQLKLTNGDPSNTYSITMMQLIDHGGLIGLTCDTVKDFGSLRTNPQGTGVKNVKLPLASGVSQSGLVLVLTDRTVPAAGTPNNLGTDKFTLVGP
jgi:hypothetical protein